MKIQVEWRGGGKLFRLFSRHTNEWLPCTVGGDGDVWLWKTIAYEGKEAEVKRAKAVALHTLESEITSFHPGLELIEVNNDA